MKKFLVNLFWFNLSNTLDLSITDTKLQLKNISDRIDSGTVTQKELSMDITKALDFYLDNIEYLT